MKKFQILHISDLHVNEKDNFDRSVVLDPLIERVKKDRDIGFRPELVAVTGDVAFKGICAEYDSAKLFFDDLMKTLDLPDRSLFIVPGNHDVDRKKYRPSDRPAYKTMRELNEELENKDFRADLLKGMDDYFTFMKKNYPHLDSLEDRLVPFVTSFTTEGGGKIGIVGLNSAWMCRKSPDEREIAMGEFQIKKAMAQLRKMGKPDLVIHLFHHPLHWLWPEDAKIGRSYFNDSMLLCGHLHDAAGGYFQDLDGRFLQFQAGASYLGSDSKFPARFQYITVDLRKSVVQLDFRKYYPGAHRWVVDSETGDDGKKIFEISPSGKSRSETISDVEVEKPEKYLKWIIENYGHMDADKLYGKGDGFPLSLPEIFVPLKAYEPGAGIGKRRDIEEKKEPLDMETIIAASGYLMIEGQPGSGKTTLLKHLAYCLARKDNKACRIDGTDNLLPVLILLKDLNRYFIDPQPAGDKRWNASDIMAWYFEKRLGGFLSIETVKAYLKVKRAVILLDGLDELLPEYRDPVVDAFADLGIRYAGNRLVVTSRPHGIEGAAVKRFGNRHITILSLDMEQVNLFIHRWFTYLYPGSTGIGGKNAQAMIGEIKDHPSIRQLIDNPLMLTAICILYHDEKELPGQRAELYKKFIDNMLYRRFTESEKVHNFLKSLAFRMHEQGFRGVDRTFAGGILERIYPRRNEEPKADYKARIDKTFDDIEPKCGLLKRGEGEYTFWHLTFQEFLTAQYIVDNSRDYSKAIAGYWKNDWYREVIELYIGYLSIENKKWANGIVEDAIDGRDKPPFNRWLLASESLVDIYKGRRDPNLEEKTRKRMLNIIDSSAQPKPLVQAGEILGWLGDPRDLTAFIAIDAGEYELENIGKMEIKSFEIGKFPVTNRWFETFIVGGGYERKNYWSHEGWKWLKQTKVKQPGYWDERKWKCPNSPVVGVTWYEAYAFTRWLALDRDDGYQYRLLTEKEWQAAAAGQEGRTYPWGDKWDKNRCSNEEIKMKKTSPAGVFQRGNTLQGISDLSGNVWEWAMSDYHSEKDLDDFEFDKEMQELREVDLDKYFSKLNEKNRQLPVLRGGSWYNGADNCRCADRYRLNPINRNVSVGFRCARTLTL